MTNRSKHVQQQWKQGLLPGIDCILFGSGNIVVANCFSEKDSEMNKRNWYWNPLCDTTIESLEKYEPDIWTEVNAYYGSVEYDEQQIVFGDGCMGNEGFVASIDRNGDLNWGIFFTFSNPINEVEIQDNMLMCKSDNKVIQINILLTDLTKIQIFNV